MLIPRFWAEARLQNPPPPRQITVRRWGWSDASQQEAQALADQRAQDAMNRILSGEDLRRREPKAAYAGADGVPIREEVVARHDPVVITRNSYGSLCLNTPNVFFADVDTFWQPSLRLNPVGCLLILITGLFAGLWMKSWLIGFGICLGVPCLYSIIVHKVNQARRPAAEVKAKEQALAVIHSFASAHPSWHLRVYETPAGYRLLAMHEVFDPAGSPAKDAFDELKADKAFANLCAVQGCFRARVSPKYWRMNYRPPVTLPKTKWPFPPEDLPRRHQWVAAYDKHAVRYASCRFLESLGSQEVHPQADAVRETHDVYCRALEDLPLA